MSIVKRKEKKKKKLTYQKEKGEKEEQWTLYWFVKKADSTTYRVAIIKKEICTICDIMCIQAALWPKLIMTLWMQNYMWLWMQRSY